MLLAFATMSDGVTLTGTLGVVVFVLLLASFGATWWLANRAIQRAPKSRLARSSWGSLCAAMIAIPRDDLVRTSPNVATVA